MGWLGLGGTFAFISAGGDLVSTFLTVPSTIRTVDNKRTVDNNRRVDNERKFDNKGYYTTSGMTMSRSKRFF